METALSYRVEGQGPPLLLIHGWGVTYSIWQDLAPRLRPHFQLIMIELPGMGGSPPARPDQSYYAACADGIEAVRQALGVDQWAALAYSIGARVAEVYLQRAAARVPRIAFLCPLRLSPAQALGLGALLQLDRRWPRVGDWVLEGWRLHGLIKVLAFNGRRERYAADWTGEISGQHRPSVKRILHELPALARRPFDVPGRPALFVWGRQDLLCLPPARPRENDRFVPGGHGAPLLQAPAVFEALLPFLQANGPGASA